MKKEKIIKNVAKCKKCGDIVESKYRHHFNTCKCGSISVDGGHDYIRRVGQLEDMVEMSEVEEIEDESIKKESR